MDRDETPIGGLASPLQPTRQLFNVSIFMDVTAIILSAFISTLFAVGVLIYILASRAYSYRGIRLKKYPVVGFLTVFIFQGALIFFISYTAINTKIDLESIWLPMLISSLLIGALYPLTQVYQHEEDKKDGVTTLSCLLGKKGTFAFSMILFMFAALLMYLLLKPTNKLNVFYLFMIYTFPVVLFFLYWMSAVWQDETKANFKNSLMMNLISTLCTTAFFINLIILNH